MQAPHGDPGELDVFQDAAALAAGAADRLCAWSQAAIDARGVAHVALTGGSSAAALFGELRAMARRTSVDWTRLQLWWGDERYVPLDHPDSNAGVAMRLLFESGMVDEVDRSEVLPVSAHHVHPFPVEEGIGRALGAEWTARRYAEMLAEVVPSTREGTPVFDVVLLGMGGDGHILSVFPRSAALDADAPMTMAVPAPTHIEPHVERVTLHPRVLEPAGHVMVMVPGRAKGAVVRDVLHGRDDRKLPARHAVRPNASWLLDRESAAALD